MLKRTIFYSAVILVLISFILIPVSTVKAESDITILNTSYEIAFPTVIIFKISVQSDVDIIKIRLNYTLDRNNFAEVIGEAWPTFTPADKVETTWIWDMRKSSLPPFASMNYWWTIENKNGDKVFSQPAKLTFNDNNYNWENTSSGGINLHWYEGDERFANELLQSALEATRRLTQDSLITLEESIDIYIYNGAADLQSAMIAPREWTGGIAFTEFNKIAIGISPGEIKWGINALAHELGHMVVHQLTYSPYGSSMPVWLDEGLAMHAEGVVDPYFQRQLEKARYDNNLISLRSLTSPFSAISDKAILSYAQSQSIVEFIINQYGSNKILDLLKLFKDGNTCDEALLKIYGFNQEQLEMLWLNSFKKEITDKSASEKNTINQTLVIILISLSTIAAAASALSLEEWYSHRLGKRKNNLAKRP